MARKIFPREKRLIMIIKKNSLKNLPHKQFWILVIFSEVEEVEIRFYLEKISSLKIDLQAKMKGEKNLYVYLYIAIDMKEMKNFSMST